MMVHCVICLDEDDEGCVVHIFSTDEKAKAYASTDPRKHVFYEYIVDHPARSETPAQ